MRSRVEGRESAEASEEIEAKSSRICREEGKIGSGQLDEMQEVMWRARGKMDGWLGGKKGSKEGRKSKEENRSSPSSPAATLESARCLDRIKLSFTRKGYLGGGRGDGRVKSETWGGLGEGC